MFDLSNLFLGTLGTRKAKSLRRNGTITINDDDQLHSIQNGFPLRKAHW